MAALLCEGPTVSRGVLYPEVLVDGCVAGLALLISLGGAQTGSVCLRSTWRPRRLAVVARRDGSC